MSLFRFFLILTVAAALAAGLETLYLPNACATEVRLTVPFQDTEPMVPLTAFKPASRKPAATAAKHGSEQPEVLHGALITFAKQCIVTMNKQRQPGIASKEILRQTDGTYKARYMAIDPDSLSASVNPTDGNTVIKYIGRMEYHEVEYISIGTDKKQALAGPFNESNRMPVTELVKFKGGKWSY